VRSLCGKRLRKGVTGTATTRPADWNCTYRSIGVLRVVFEDAPGSGVFFRNGGRPFSLRKSFIAHRERDSPPPLAFQVAGRRVGRIAIFHAPGTACKVSPAPSACPRHTPKCPPRRRSRLWGDPCPGRRSQRSHGGAALCLRLHGLGRGRPPIQPTARTRHPGGLRETPIDIAALSWRKYSCDCQSGHAKERRALWLLPDDFFSCRSLSR
jgi:hypothetical protein